MLLAAALLLAVGIVAAAVVGAFLRRDDPVRITSDPAVDAPAFVDEAFAAHRFLPPMTLVARLWDLDGGPVDVQRFYRQRHGAPAPRVLRRHDHHHRQRGRRLHEPGRIRATRSGSSALPGTVRCTPGIRARDVQRLRHPGLHGRVGAMSGRTASSTVTAHHLACPRQPQGDVELPDLELWLDAELGITLRSATWGVQMDENGQPVSPVGSEMAVESIVFGEPDPALFEPPPGLRAITLAEYTCEYDPASCDDAPRLPRPRSRSRRRKRRDRPATHRTSTRSSRRPCSRTSAHRPLRS